MSITKKASDFLIATGASIKSLAKLCIESRSALSSFKNKKDRASNRILILGNGPSLADTMESHMQDLRKETLMAVNFAANTPSFQELRPAFYILIDPLFFSKTPTTNVKDLWENLSKASWPITIIIPAREDKRVKHILRDNPNINVAKINPVAIEGYCWLENFAYNKALGMPRPRNVLVPAIMSAIALGYKEIYIYGADHSWMKTISVDEENHVVSIQPHFYKDDEKELKRVRTDYLNYRLHEIVESFAIAFRSYHTLQRYAKSHGIKIFNSTPGSFIDAFPRQSPF